MRGNHDHAGSAEDSGSRFDRRQRAGANCRVVLDVSALQAAKRARPPRALFVCRLFDANFLKFFFFLGSLYSEFSELSGSFVSSFEPQVTRLISEPVPVNARGTSQRLTPAVDSLSRS